MNKLSSLSARLLGATAVMACLGSAALADHTSLTIATTTTAESTTGELIQQFEKDVRQMSDGDIDVQIFYSGSLVKASETFDAVINGVASCDMTNGSYQTGKNPAFQFVADVMGGYDTPLQFMSWIYYGGGKQAINKLYNSYNMQFVGAFMGGQESLVSSRPLKGVEDLKGFKFRSPPGMESEIFASLGAKPVVMDFNEIFTSLETKIIDGADASTLTNNFRLGLYDVVHETTFPGFHSMSADHLACNKDVWEAMPKAHQVILESAMQKLSMNLMMKTLVLNGEAAAKAPKVGLNLYDWSKEDRATFRAAAKSRWQEWAKKTPETAELVKSHVDFLDRIGLGGEK